MNVFERVSNFFVNLWTNVLKPDVEKAEAVAVTLFSAAAKDAAEQLGIQGIKIVTDAVEAAEKAGGSGQEKLAAALATITADLATAGLAVATHVVNATIEAVVAQLNQNNKEVTTPVEEPADENVNVDPPEAA